MVYGPPRGPTWEVIPLLLVLGLAGAARLKWGAVRCRAVGRDIITAEELPVWFAARRHSMRLLARSIASHASSRIAGTAALLAIERIAIPAQMTHRLMRRLLMLCRSC